ncbi:MULTISPECIES: DUF2569 family protein [unclassified Bradyrhizobium]|uniref:DUF2569 family protein n=1 Tax=unclassified Bradyrhizobium TaxID=2631580 RepID=UPI001FF5AF96|nr:MULTISPECIES: DUF2569 family protein [unclassified Bradyrhizobium]MCJ9701463.1 DUF2569 family protein [Bradyrhizobium sp. SHOUNA76]MCJ9730655.1 DUF2569 family protein [Bradyrhizobium sp. PRIMUS42]
MTDLWYYADGGQQHGPFSISELLPLLAGIADPGRVMVWQHGSADWKPVEEVREIALQLFQPSPLPPASPQVQAIGEPAVPAEDATVFKDAQPEWSGITGWLALLAIGQVLGIMRLVFSVGQYVQSITDEVWTQFPTVIWSEMLINAAMIGFAIWTAVLLFRHSRRFPAFFIVQMICAVLMPYVDLLCVASFFSAALDRPFGDFFVIEARQVGQTIVGAVSATVWITYVLRSRRVATTFTK